MHSLYSLLSWDRYVQFCHEYDAGGRKVHKMAKEASSVCSQHLQHTDEVRRLRDINSRNNKIFIAALCMVAVWLLFKFVFEPWLTTHKCVDC